MFKSTGARYLLVGLLALLMYIPMFMIGIVVDDRASYSRQTARSVGQEFGGPQTLNGPFLQIPVIGPVERIEQKTTTDPATGQTRTEDIKRIVQAYKKPLHVLPNQLDLTINSQSETRSRGIFTVPVYKAAADYIFDFDLTNAAKQLSRDERFDLGKTKLIFGVSQNRSLRGAAILQADGQNIPLEPRTGEGGLYADMGDPNAFANYTLKLEFNGAEQIYVTPVARNSNVTMISDWPHPSFQGAFLPDTRDITDQGFTAKWSIPHFARSLPQLARQDLERLAQQSAFGFKFYQPNDFYQKAYRAAHYGILFIALTFLTVLLLEGPRKTPIHPVQYLLVGLAQSVFVLLMVAYAEQIGFTPAYLLASGATIALLTMFAALGLKLGRRTPVLAALLIVIYAVLYLILRSADYALLVGSTLAFAAIAATMFFTRNEDWGRFTPTKPVEDKTPDPKDSA